MSMVRTVDDFNDLMNGSLDKFLFNTTFKDPGRQKAKDKVTLILADFWDDTEKFFEEKDTDA